MPLEISEDVVSLAYQNLGYFVIEGRKIGRREIDLLAIRLGDDGEVAERLHVEVHVSIHPIGVLRPEPGLASGRDPRSAARKWAEKKFEGRGLVEAVKDAFGITSEQDYRRVLVHGRMRDRSQAEVLTRLGIECVAIERLVGKALKSGVTNRLQRAYDIAELLVSPLGEQK